MVYAFLQRIVHEQSGAGRFKFALGAQILSLGLMF